ncbi:acyltransferase [Methanomassiliicoccus luminyensis]|uniref:acyltransferase n=1 Tax=Methanomassiliicoccus luminyensis TaxID=1080712 RepID=UPI000369DC77|nr:acyltransferase [Methanomassiliicoccus luminyensis]
MSAGKSGWRGEFDYLRGFAILAIVWIHVGAFYVMIGHPSAIAPINEFLTHFADFGVPLFFFISGFVLTLRYFKVDSAPKFYVRRLAFIVPPYVVFTAIYGIYSVLFVDTSVQRATLSFALFDAAGAFWFIAIIIQLYLLFPLLTRWYARLEARGQGWRLAGYSLVLYVLWWSVLFPATQYAIDLVGGSVVPDLGAIVAERLFPGYLIFFVLGIFACRSPSLTSRWYRTLSGIALVPAAAIMAVGLMFLKTGFWWAMLVLPFSIVMFALLARASYWLMARPGWVSRGLQAIGVYSYGIYLIHVLIIAVVVKGLLTAGLGYGDAAFYLALYPITVALSFLALWVINKLPLGHYATGVRTKKKTSEKSMRSRSAEGRKS